MQKPTDPRDTLKQLGKAATRQNQQFVASLLISVAVMMKKQGLARLDITPEDMAALQPGETLLPVVNIAGGLSFEFQQDPGAKLPVPVEMQEKSTKKKARRK